MIAPVVNRYTTRQRGMYGIQHTTIRTYDEDILNAYVQFAYHHTGNDIEMYENAATLAPLTDQKQLFFQLACIKGETLLRLRKNYPHAPSVWSAQGGKSPAGSLTRYILDLESSSLLTLDDALNLAYWRENKSMLLYEKLRDSVYSPAVSALFGILILTQQECIAHITQRIARTCISLPVSKESDFIPV